MVLVYIVWQNGEKYEGYYKQDKRHGEGTYIWPSGATFQGNFISDKKVGVGVVAGEWC